MRGATRCFQGFSQRPAISIHAPREGRDRSELSFPRRAFYFNPRAPRGARLAILIFVAVAVLISIHAPREGRDRHMLIIISQRYNFNPRAPRGARPCRCIRRYCLPEFQSTRPARGATQTALDRLATSVISIHAPREGRDCAPQHKNAAVRNFNPRAPRGARLEAAAERSEP